MRNGNRSVALLHSAATSACIIGITAHLLVEAVPGFPVNIFSASAYNLGLITQALLLSLSVSAKQPKRRTNHKESRTDPS